jgi:glycosyltransferase involved in cell wall biosynthesis
MRIGLMIYGSLDYLSGGFLYDRMLVEHLKTAGDEVRIFALPWRSYPRNLLDNLFDRLTRGIRQADLDVLLQDELNHPSLVLTNRRLKKHCGCPVVAIVHHLRSREPRPAAANAFYRAVERAYLQTVDGFVFNSRSTRNAVERLLAKPLRQVTATPGGDRLGKIGDDRVLAERCNKDGPLRLLFIGSVIGRKDLGGLLAALARIKDIDWRLEVVGPLDVDRSYAARMQTRALAAGMGPKVFFHGPADDPALRGLLRAGHLVALPFSYEGFGIVFLEGMAFGLPALACRRGGAGEVVAHGVSGLLFAPGDTAALAAAIARLATDRRELLRLSRAARRRFDAFPTWHGSMQAIRQFLAGIALRGRRN